MNRNRHPGITILPALHSGGGRALNQTWSHRHQRRLHALQLARRTRCRHGDKIGRLAFRIVLPVPVFAFTLSHFRASFLAFAQAALEACSRYGDGQLPPLTLLLFPVELHHYSCSRLTRFRLIPSPMTRWTDSVSARGILVQNSSGALE